MTMELPEIQASIRRAKAGRAEGFESILAAYGPRLYGYFLRVTGDAHDSEDLLGETMLRVVAHLGRYDERGRFEPWLFRIAANLVRDRFRRRRAAGPVLALAESADGADPIDELPGPSEPPEAPLLAAEQHDRLMAALGELDQATRETIVLRHFSAMSFAEIAEVMNCPVGTALARAHRGLRTLRRRLQDTGPTSDGHDDDERTTIRTGR